MSNDMIGVVVLVIFVSGLGGLWIASVVRHKRREAAYPTTWVHIGAPVPHADLALEVIYKSLAVPPKRWGGLIEWVDGPFMCGKIRAAGCLVDDATPKITLMRIEPIECCALAHEVKHWVSYLEGKGYQEGAPEFKEWVAKTNVEIGKARLKLIAGG